VIPASFVGVLFLFALIPGVIFLHRTDDQRSSFGDSSPLEEILTVVSAGAATVAPPLLVALVGLPESVSATVGTVKHLETATLSDLRELGWFLIAVALSSIALAFAFAEIFKSSSDVNGVADLWGVALDDLQDDHTLMVAVVTSDGVLIQGASDGYSTGRKGRDRDLMLLAPISMQLPRKKLKESPYRRMMISESQIAYFATANFPNPVERDDDVVTD
jgi:hypothetical protein